jgi:hypothetical protein
MKMIFYEWICLYDFMFYDNCLDDWWFENRLQGWIVKLRLKINIK